MIPNATKTTELELGTIADLTPDEKNANRGTQRGLAMLEDSLRRHGAGRSILVDKHGRVIAGNKTLESAASIGLEDVVIVKTDGTKIVAVQRTDIDLDTPEGRRLAVADNRTSEVGLDWDVDRLTELLDDGLDLGGLFTDHELAVGNWHGEEADPDKLWQGMPEFEQNENPPFRSLIVHFASREDVEAFTRAIGQTITDKTKYVWFPPKERLSRNLYPVADES